MREVPLRECERLDDLMHRGRKLIQNTQEFCFSLDAVLLAHFPQLRPRQRVLELGTGTGVIPLLIAEQVAHIDAVELSPVMAELAARNVWLNELEECITVREGDYRQIETLYARESYDWVLANPPYRPVTRGQANALTGVARARHEFTATLMDVVRAARYALRYGGRLALVHLPERLQFVQSRVDKAPNMLLIEAVVGGAPGGLRVLPPLIVHDAAGGYTQAIREIYGDA